MLLSQNLVKNGSFEKHADIVCLSCHHRAENFSYTMKPWKNLSTGSPFICDCKYTRNQDEKRTRICNFEMVQPHDGCTMMELSYVPACLDHNHQTRGCSSYLATEFVGPMQVGSVYEVSFWVYLMSPDDPEYARHIGMSLFPEAIRNPHGALLGGAPFLIDTVIYNSWYKVKWNIKSTCNLQFLVIGVFRGTDGPPVNQKPHRNTFYVDDVKVKKISADLTPEVKVYTFCRPEKEEAVDLKPEIKGVECHFSSNSSYLTKEEQVALDLFANRVKGHPDIAFTITGHTDSIGKNHFELSKERVESVLKYLEAEHRLPGFRFVSVFAGNSEPAASNATEVGRKRNRRVEMRQSDYDMPNVFYRNILLYLADGKINEAYKALFAWLYIAKDEKKMLMLYDPRLDMLKNGKRWREVERRVKKTYNRFKKPKLAYLLDSLWVEDQKYRTLEYHIENLNTYLYDIDEGDEKWDVSFNMEEDSIVVYDSLMFLTIDSLITKEGWPKSSEVGERPAKATFLIITHSNDTLALSRSVLMVKKRCLEGEADWYWYATMYDRLKTLKGKPQKYGTQYRFIEGGNGKKKLFPLENESKVNEWREEIGLPPIGID